ncbi:MAG: hypothetical protein GX933_10285 [Chloroflexi bacterium]|nr:hypothetical protein [Chloroflexota bacterium]
MSSDEEEKLKQEHNLLDEEQYLEQQINELKPKNIFLLKHIALFAIIILILLIILLVKYEKLNHGILRSISLSIIVISLSEITLVIYQTHISSRLESNKKRLYEIRSLKRQSRLEERIIENPEKVSPAWELASEKFNAYNAENFSQVKQIYKFSRWFMFVGFILIGGSVVIALVFPDRLSLALIAGISGVIIEFLSTVVLSFYKTLLAHSMNYIRVLDRTSKVGVALQILDSLSAEEGEPQNYKKEIIEAKIHIAKGMFSDAGLSGNKSDDNNREENDG